MPKERRQLGPDRYYDTKGRVRTHSARLTNAARGDKLFLKASTFERTFPNKLIDPILIQETSGGEYLWRYSVKLGPKHPVNVGYIKRGHREIHSFRLRHVFTKALRKLEEIERGYFKDGKFLNYREAILLRLRLDCSNIRAYEAFVKTLKSPVHIDYTRKIDTAIALLRNGYELGAPSIAELLEHGISTRGGTEKIIARLKKAPNLSYNIFLLFTKKPKKE